MLNILNYFLHAYGAGSIVAVASLCVILLSSFTRGTLLTRLAVFGAILVTLWAGNHDVMQARVVQTQLEVMGDKLDSAKEARDDAVTRMAEMRKDLQRARAERAEAISETRAARAQIESLRTWGLGLTEDLADARTEIARLEAGVSTASAESQRAASSADQVIANQAAQARKEARHDFCALHSEKSGRDIPLPDNLGPGKCVCGRAVGLDAQTYSLGCVRDTNTGFGDWGGSPSYGYGNWGGSPGYGYGYGLPNVWGR